MSKRFFILVLCISLVLGSFVPVFAVSTDSAIKLKSVGTVSDTRATTAATTVEPDDSQATRYYVNSNGSVTSSSTWINTWGNIVTDITYSLAYSADIIENRLLTLINNLSSYLYSSSTTGYYLWDWSSSNGPSQGSPTGTQSVVSQLRSMGSSLSKLLSYSTEYNYQASESLNNIHEILTSGGAFDLQPVVDALNHSDFVGESYSGSLSQTIWQSNDNGTWTTFNQSVSQARRFQNLLIFLTALQRNQALTNASLRRGSGSDVITNNDLSTTSITSQSVQQTLQNYGTNISSLLARLSFVLASDDEIAARQSAADNQDSAVNNFISSSGSGSFSSTDLGDMASGSAAIKSALSSNASASDAFGVFNNDSSIWDWFTQSIKDSFDNVSRTRDSASYTSYYEDYISKVLQGVNENECR